MTDKEHAALGIVKTLSAQGFQALYAGGYVRNMLMGLDNPGDIDIATSATPSTIRTLFRHVVGVGEHFGVMIVVEKGFPFEVATFRCDRGIHDGRHPQRVAFSDARADALRRDFTINGLFYNPLNRKIIDYVAGRKDLTRRIIRAIGDARLRFEEDYLRLLRAIRFSARFSFSIEPKTWEALMANADGIGKISKERIFQELDKILAYPHADLAMKLLHESGLLERILPEVEAMVGVEQPREFHPEGDVFEHTLKALALLGNPSQVLAWSTLLHDIGKPGTMRIAKDRIRFNNHNRVGARLAERVLRRLKVSNALIEGVSAVIDNHMNFINVKKMRLSTMKKFLARPWFDDELELHRIDCIASHGNIENYDFLLEKKKGLAQEELLPAPVLRGQDLIDLGFSPGPVFGIILHDAYELQLDEKLPTREKALEWIRSKKQLYQNGRMPRRGGGKTTSQRRTHGKPAHNN